MGQPSHTSTRQPAGRTEDLALIWQLRTIAQNFLLPYIEVPELDMQQVLRYVTF